MFHRGAALLAVAVVGVLLTGCAPVATPAPSASTPAPAGPNSLSPPPATPTPTPVSQTIGTIPSCDSLLTVDAMRDATQTESAENLGPIDDFDGSYLPGPVAQRTFSEADASSACSFGIPQTDAGAYTAVALLEARARDDLMSALRSLELYTETVRGDIRVFSMPIESGLGSSIAYAFYANVWVIADGTFLSEETAGDLAVAALTGVIDQAQ